MMYPVPIGPPSTVFSSKGHGSLLSGVFNCSVVLQSMKFPADPESLKAGIRKGVSKYSITVETLDKGMGRKGEVLTSEVF